MGAILFFVCFVFFVGINYPFVYPRAAGNRRKLFSINGIPTMTTAKAASPPRSPPGAKMAANELICPAVAGVVCGA